MASGALNSVSMVVWAFEMKGMDTRGNSQVIKADVPLSELFGYITDLRTISSGRATANLTFSHYDEVPRNIAETVIKKEQGATV